MAVCNITALYRCESQDDLLRRAWEEGLRAEAEATGIKHVPPHGGADEGAMDATGLLLPPILWDGVRWNRCGSRHRRGG